MDDDCALDLIRQRDALQAKLESAEARIAGLEAKHPEWMKRIQRERQEERERIIALLLTDKIQVWLPEAGDLWPAQAEDLRKLFNP